MDTQYLKTYTREQLVRERDAALRLAQKACMFQETEDCEECMAVANAASTQIKLRELMGQP